MCENIFITIVGEHHIPPPKQIFLYKCMLSNIRKNTWSFRTTSIDSNECDSISHEIILPSDLLPHNLYNENKSPEETTTSAISDVAQPIAKKSWIFIRVD